MLNEDLYMSNNRIFWARKPKRERERDWREREIGDKEREREQGLENTKDRNKLGHYWV